MGPAVAGGITGMPPGLVAGVLWTFYVGAPTAWTLITVMKAVLLPLPVMALFQ